MTHLLTYICFAVTLSLALVYPKSSGCLCRKKRLHWVYESPRAVSLVRISFIGFKKVLGQFV